MRPMRRFLPLFVIAGVVVLVAAVVIVAQMLGTPPDDTRTDPAATGEPRHETRPGESDEFLSGAQMPAQLAAGVARLDSLEYPSDDVKAAALARLGSLDFGGEMVWEAGIEENIVLDNWECTWLEHAAAAAEENDTQELIRAGEAIKKRADVPGQRDERFPGIDAYIERVIEPLARGEWLPAKQTYESNKCLEYLEVGSTR